MDRDIAQSEEKITQIEMDINQSREKNHLIQSQIDLKNQI